MFSLRISALLLLFSFVLLACMAGCVHNTPSAGSPVSSTPQIVSDSSLPVSASMPASEGFVSDAACAECHPQVFRDHQASRHASTLHLAARSSLGDLAPKMGPLPGSHARIVQVGDGYQVQMPGGGAGPLQYVLGSGKSGMTYVTLMDSHVFEMRASYFPHLGKWKITPGQKNIAQTAMGVDHKDEDARACIQCHATTLPPDSNVPEKRFFGVGCEACHGAGGAHVTAMRSGNTADIHIERLGKWDARRVNDMCGQCHRNAEGAGMTSGDTPDLSVTSRFQPYALMLSRCFKESDNTLSCNTCHNPHQNTSHDMRKYEEACLNCHSRTGRKDRETGRQEEAGTTKANLSSHSRNSHSGSSNIQLPMHNASCPVNPRSGCIGCHMPRKPLLMGTGITASAPDHFIRVRRPALEARWERQAAKHSTSTSMNMMSK